MHPRNNYASEDSLPTRTGLEHFRGLFSSTLSASIRFHGFGKGASSPRAVFYSHQRGEEKPSDCLSAERPLPPLTHRRGSFSFSTPSSCFLRTAPPFLPDWRSRQAQRRAKRAWRLSFTRLAQIRKPRKLFAFSQPCPANHQLTEPFIDFLDSERDRF